MTPTTQTQITSPVSRPVFFGYMRVMVPLLFVYFALTGNLWPTNIFAGVVVSFIISWLTGAPPWDVQPGSLPKSAYTAARYVILLLRDIFKSGVHVTELTIARDMPIRPGIIGVISGSPDPALHATSAHGITVTPGEMVIEMSSEGSLYTHCLDLNASSGIQGGQDDRKIQIEKIISPSFPAESQEGSQS